MMMATDYARPPARRPAGLALTVLVHLVLLAGWQMSRHAPPADGRPEPGRTAIQWIRLAPVEPRPPTPARPAGTPPRARAITPAPSSAAPAATPAPTTPAPITLVPAAPASATPDTPAQPGATAPQDALQAPASPAQPSTARDILQRARRDAGAIDRALRKENNPYIVAPLDSPQIRMRNKMQAAHDAVPPRAWEAPAVEELGNESGAPVTRVRGALGTYCLTARSPGAGIDAFERKGGIRRTACPNASSQGGSEGWRTARD